jgi:GR25 family glycosyltransferase involved in LPS biosynthesis
MYLALSFYLLLISGAFCDFSFVPQTADPVGVDIITDAEKTAFDDAAASLRNLRSIHGKSYIITTKNEIPNDAFVAATKVGFEPILFPATQPLEREFKSVKAMYQKCLPELSGLQTKKRLSLGELALICSHRRVLETIVQDTSVGENDWSLVLEDDVKLHPKAWNVSESLVQEVLSMADSSVNESYGFIYFGLKINRRQRTGERNCLRLNATDSGLIARDCSGHGTHAFAITKRRARSFIKEVYSADNILRGNQQLQIDQVFSRHFINMDILIRPSTLSVNPTRELKEKKEKKLCKLKTTYYLRPTFSVLDCLCVQK